MQSLYNQSQSDYFASNGSEGLGATNTGLWTPSSITTALWLDASDSSTITLNGSNVSDWNDKSGNSRNATQATAASQPLYATNATNGLNVIRADANGEFLGLASALTVGSIFIVYATESGQTTAQNRFLLGDNVGLTRAIDFHGGNASSLLFNSSLTTGLIGFPSSTRVDGSAIDPFAIVKTTNYTVLSIQAVASGTQVFSSLGCDNTDTTNRSWRGDYAEVIVLGSSATITQTFLLEGYLAWKWGIESSLPINHPYKNLPPRV